MEVYNTDYALYVQDGEHEPKQATNFTPVIETAYFNLEGPQDIPAYLGIELILEDGSMRRLTLPMTSNLARRIVAEEPRAVLLKTGYAPLIQKYIVDQLSKAGRPGECQRGLYLPGNGTYRLADDQHITVWNGRVAGSSEFKVPYVIKPNSNYQIVNRIENPVQTLVNALLGNDAALVLPVAYALLVSRRDVLSGDTALSFCQDAHVAAQARTAGRGAHDGTGLDEGLYITGVQSSGKTTLARRIFGYTERIGTPGKPALMLEAVSTEASVRDTLSENPGCVVIIDDLAKSSTRSIEAHRRKLGGAMLRLAANEGDSTKKNSSGKTDHHDCAAGIALTAEFVLDGVSELTRSIFVYLDKQLNLSEDVRPALIGAILEDFADWFADNYEHAIELLHKIADSPDILKNLRVDGADEFTELLTRERRIQDNLALLQWAFVGMVEMIKARMELPSSDEHALNEKFWEAVHRSVRKQVTEFRMIQSKFKEGNIAFLLCEAIDSDEFDLCRKKTNLFKRNGIIWKEKKGVIKQVGIKQTALVQFIRNQNGYQNYSSRKITDYMKDIGCLTINEDKSNTVHIGKLKDGKRPLPRVLLIDVQTLRDNAEKYELFAEQARE